MFSGPQISPVLGKGIYGVEFKVAFPGTVAWRSPRRGVAFSVLQGRAEGCWSSHCSLFTSFPYRLFRSLSRCPPLSLTVCISQAACLTFTLSRLTRSMSYLISSNSVCLSHKLFFLCCLSSHFCLMVSHRPPRWTSFLVMLLSHIIKVKQTSCQKLGEVTRYSSQYHELRLFFGLKRVFTAHFCQCIIKQLWLSAHCSKENIDWWAGDCVLTGRSGSLGELRL